MRVLVTGADRPLGRDVARHLARDHEVRLCGLSQSTTGLDRYWQVDLRAAEAIVPLVTRTDAIVHVAEFEPLPRPDLDLLEHASLGTYRLLSAAREAGVSRIVLVSRLSFFDAYPERYLIDELWRPWPSTEAPELAPFLAEMVTREFAHEGSICAVCLRFSPIGSDPERNTTLADALEAIDRALTLEFTVPGHR